jgi:hypothetical protein
LSIYAIGRQVRPAGPCDRAELVDSDFSKLCLISKRFEDGAKQAVAQVDLTACLVVKLDFKSISLSHLDTNNSWHIHLFTPQAKGGILRNGLWATANSQFWRNSSRWSDAHSNTIANARRGNDPCMTSRVPIEIDASLSPT